MRYYITYVVNENQLGATTARIEHDPPTRNDIVELQKQIAEKFFEGKDLLVTGWYPLSEEEDANAGTEDIKAIAFRIKNTDLHVGDTLEIEDEVGHCLYKVEFGLYTFAERSHMGWYLKLDSVNQGYPEESLVMERPVCDIREDPAIKSIKVIV